MTTPTGYSVTMPHRADSNALKELAQNGVRHETVLDIGGARRTLCACFGQAYRTKKSLVAVHFDQDGKGGIVFLPEGVTLRVARPSSCLREGLEMVFGKEFHNVFEVDLARCSQIFEPIQTRSRAVAA